MARPGVTYLDVAHAAQQLVAAGKSPTIESIRFTLGTGSNSTLGTHLRAWKAKQDETQQLATKEKIPEELIVLLKGLWERVMNQADEKIQVIREESQQEFMQLQQTVHHLQQESIQWQQQHHQIKQERDGLAHEKSAIEQLLTQAKIEIAALAEKTAGTEQQIQEKEERIHELRHQNQQIQNNLEHYREASLEQRLAEQQRHEQQQQQFEHTIQQLNQQVTILKKENEVLLQRNQQTLSDNNSLKTQLTSLKSQHDSISLQLTDTLTELAKKSQAQQHWHDQFLELQQKYDKEHQEKIAVQTQLAVALQQLETITHELKGIREQNKSLAHEKWLLGQEKAQLHGQLKQFQQLHSQK